MVKINRYFRHTVLYCPVLYLQGLAGVKGSRETGGSLALRALGRGSLYAFGGFSAFCFAMWKLSGASSVSDHSGCVIGHVIPCQMKMCVLLYVCSRFISDQNAAVFL